MNLDRPEQSQEAKKVPGWCLSSGKEAARYGLNVDLIISDLWIMFWINTKKKGFMLLIKELVMPVRGLTQISFHASKRQQIITFPPKGVINF